MAKESLEELAHASYWDKRYASSLAAAPPADSDSQTPSRAEIDSFEWFKDYKTLQPFLEGHLPLPPSAVSILHLGCGNSTLTADLHNAGYSFQLSVDFSTVVISAMQAKYASLNTRWEVMDVRDLKLNDGDVDVAIDKGTLDAMIHGSPWDPPEEVRENVRRYVDEVGRVVKKGGQWLYVTYRQPHFIRPLLERGGVWDVTFEVLGGEGGGFEYYGWVLKRL